MNFVEGMTELMQDKTVLYETMIRNIYGLGVCAATRNSPCCRWPIPVS